MVWVEIYIPLDMGSDLEKSSGLGNFLYFVMVVAGNSSLKKQSLMCFSSVFSTKAKV